MDGLDWSITLIGAMTGFIVLVKVVAGGITLFEPRSARSLLTIAGLAGLWITILLTALDTARPVRTTVYLINGDAAAIEVEAGDVKGCLSPKSYAVLTWRGDAPSKLLVTNDEGEPIVTATLGPGIWVANPSTTKIAADFVNSGGGNQTLEIDHEHLTSAKLGKSRIYRVFTDLSDDQIYSGKGDIVPANLTRSCHPKGK